MTTTEVTALDNRGQRLPVVELTRHWPLGGWHEVQAIAGGKNDHFRLTAGDGSYFLRRSYRSKTAADLDAQLAFVASLHERGLPVPVAVETVEGHRFAQVEDRLWTVTRALAGTPYDEARPGHLVALGRSLAAYHRTVADLDVGHGEPGPLTELRERVDDPVVDDWLHDRAVHVVHALGDLSPGLPWVMIHGGARRGSLLFDDDRVSAVLDFDSARPDARVLDLAIAAHDVGKVYTEVGAADHKVALDLSRVASLVGAYRESIPLGPAEARALPLLIEAKRLKRALGRLRRVAAGEDLSPNDHAKIELERSRLRWLEANSGALTAVCSSRGG